MNTSTTPPPAQPQVQLAIQKIYLKDASFETPAGVKVFQQAWSPKLSQQLQTRSNKLDNALFDVVLMLTLTAIVGEVGKEETAFIIEIQQGGVFQVIAPNTALELQIVNTTCPGILLPYAREAADSLAVKGGFPAISVPPVNFDVLYQQALAQQQPGKAAH
jgi:preprotein translocase subunit SecB